MPQPINGRNRSQHETIKRLLWLAEGLRAGLPFTSVTAAEHLRADERTIKRDLLLLRQLGWKIQWHKPKHTYVLTYAPPAKLL